MSEKLKNLYFWPFFRNPVEKEKRFIFSSYVLFLGKKILMVYAL